ncbi:hypothetical protein JCM10450v2_004400 [Rhodotorula kratochvilovae]
MVWRTPSQATRALAQQPSQQPEEPSPSAQLERSNTTTTFTSFFLGKALRRDPSTRRADDPIAPPSLPYLYPRAPAQRALALRASKLVQVEKLPRDERIAAWQGRRDEELGGLERWRREVAEEVEREEEERRTSTGIAVRRAVGEIEGLLGTSPFSTSFSVEALALPPSPVPPESPGVHIDPQQRDSASSFLSPVGIVTTAEVVHPYDGIEPNTVVLPTSSTLPPPPQTPKSFVPPYSPPLEDAQLLPPPSYRFPSSGPPPPTPPFPSLTRIATSPVTPASREPAPWTGSPPPRTSSLPFGDLLHVTPPAAASSLPAQCGLIPPKAAALLGLFDPAAAARGRKGSASEAGATLGGGGSDLPPRPRAPFFAADARKDSMETASSLLTGTGTGTGTGGSRAPFYRAGNGSYSSLAYSVPTTAGTAPTTAAAGAKLSLDLTRGVPRVVVPPSSFSSRPSFSSSYGGAPPPPRPPKHPARLVLRQAGLSSLPDLHAPAAATAHRSVHPPPAAPWANWEDQQQQQEELDSVASSDAGDVESAVDGFDFGLVERMRARRKSSFRCRGQRAKRGDRIEVGGGAGRAHGAAHAREKDGAGLRTLVRSLSRGSLRAGGGLVRALSGRRAPAVGEKAHLVPLPPPVVVTMAEKRARRKTRDEWELESAMIGGRMKRGCCL